MKRSAETTGAAWMIMFTAVFSVLYLVIGLPWWLAAPVALGVMSATVFLVAFTAALLRDTAPRGIPAELGDPYRTCAYLGWRRTRVHPWWRCEGRREIGDRAHVHLTRRQPGQLRRERRVLLMIGDGITTSALLKG